LSRPGETICASSQRDAVVYSSLSNRVEIRVVAAHRSDYFMMKIEGTAYLAAVHAFHQFISDF